MNSYGIGLKPLNEDTIQKGNYSSNRLEGCGSLGGQHAVFVRPKERELTILERSGCDFKLRVVVYVYTICVRNFRTNILVTSEINGNDEA
jgi:hypothetical protein